MKRVTPVWIYSFHFNLVVDFLYVCAAFQTVCNSLFTSKINGICAEAKKMQRNIVLFCTNHAKCTCTLMQYYSHNVLLTIINDYCNKNHQYWMANRKNYRFFFLVSPSEILVNLLPALVSWIQKEVMIQRNYF